MRPNGFLTTAALTMAVLTAAGCSQKTWVAEYEGGVVELSPYERELALGANRYKLGRLAEADEHLREAEKLAQSPGQRAKARSARGAVAARRGDLESAETYLREAIELDAELGDAWVYLGRVYLLRADTLGAISVLSDGLRAAPESPQVEAALGRTYYEWGGYEQAVLHLRRALDEEPRRQPWVGWLDDALVATGAPPASGAPEPAPAEAPEEAPGVPAFEAPEPARAPLAVAIGPLTYEPTAEDVAALERRAAETRRKRRLTRADFAILVAAYGPPVRPWPTPRDLPPDAVDHEDASYIAIALLGRWLRADLEGFVHPDSLLLRAEAAYLLEPQVRRYPALMKSAKHPEPASDVTPEDRLYYPATTVAASGLLELTADGRFRPDDPLTGEEGAAVAERLRAAVRAQSTGTDGSAGDAGGLP